MDVEELKRRTKQLAVDVILLCRKLKSFPESNVIKYQLIKSVSSVAANYRAACRSRSKNEWYSKLCIVVEEADETLFWMELIGNLGLSETWTNEYVEIKSESEQILKIFAKAKRSFKFQNE